jgi:hypothetical protein
MLPQSVNGARSMPCSSFRSPHVAMSIPAILGGLCVFWASPHGPGVTPDTVDYFAAAESFAASGAFQTWSGSPLTNFPPGYPILLAGGCSLLPDMLQSARWVCTLSFAANTYLTGLATFYATNKNIWAGLCAALLFVTFPQVLMLHLSAMSEGPFITFCLLSTVLLCRYAASAQVGFLLASAVFLGAAAAIRYAGVALFIPAAAVLLRSNRRFSRQEFANWIAFILIGASPLVLILSRNLLYGGSATNRQLAFHPPPFSELWSLIYSLRMMFLPSFSFRIPAGAKFFGLLLACGVLGGLTVALIAHRKRAAEPLGIAMSFRLWNVVFVVAYLLFLLAVSTIVEADLTFDCRILLPLAPSLTMLAVVAGSAAQDVAGRRWSMGALLLLATGLVSTNAICGARDLLRARRDGLGYNSEKWLTSEAVQFAETSRRVRRRVYSNAPEALWFAGHFESLALPLRFNVHTRRENPLYSNELTAVCDEIASDAAVAIVFSSIDRRFMADTAEFERCRALHCIPLADGTAITGLDSDATAAPDSFR